jgi:hypothetical protein
VETAPFEGVNCRWTNKDVKERENHRQIQNNKVKRRSRPTLSEQLERQRIYSAGSISELFKRKMEGEEDRS